jgi:hypothetical protein
MPSSRVDWCGRMLELSRDGHFSPRILLHG